MNIQELFDSLKTLLNGSQPPIPQPAPGPASAPQPPRQAEIALPEGIKLEAKKAIHTLALVDRAYNLGIWASQEVKAKWVHDLTVYLYFHNLAGVTLELLAADKTVLAAIKVQFGQHANGKATGPPNGTEVPVIDKKLVASHRVIVHHEHDNAAAYQRFLKLSWAPAETLRRRQGDEFPNCQAQKTGGRQTGSIFNNRESRHELVVTRPIGTKGYGFADAPDLRLTGVLLHRRHFRCPLNVKLGQRLTAQLIQLPAGIQAREVRVA